MNIVTVNLFKRPFHARLCLESLARAQRWSATVESKGWADLIAVCLACNATEHPYVIAEAEGVIERNPDVPFEFWRATPDIPSNPHAMSKWMLDRAFAAGADMALYVEDDAVMAPDALLMCEYVKQANRYYADPCMEDHDHFCISDAVRGKLLGCCLYHETIPAQYKAENRSPDPALLHMSNGLNTCGGTAFLRDPYLKYLSGEWNCKTVEPKGFDYSAHFLMYLHNLYMVWPDYSRSLNYGFTGGSIAESEWSKYFGRSIAVTDHEALRDWRGFRMDGETPRRHKEDWMDAELRVRGLLP
jgi:hypothetical protein